MVPDHLRDLIQALSEMPITSPPESWRHVSTLAVGGLTHVGYTPDSDLILVVSSQGRGVIDCETGEKLARDNEEFFEGYDEIKLTAPGIGPLTEQTIRLAGLSGGGLPKSAQDGWHLDAIPLPWPDYSVFLVQPWKSIYTDGAWVATKVGNDSTCELRAYGFSETGNTFVIATSCDLHVFARSEVHESAIEG